MGILNNLERRGRAENPKVPLSAANVLESLGMEVSTPAGVSVTADKALGITAFWAGVRAISQTWAGLPCQVFERTGEKSRKRAPDHPTHRLLAIRPNPHMSPFTWKEMRAAHILTWGNNYSEIEYDGAGRPIALWPLLPDRTGVEVKNGKKVFWTMVDGVKVWLAANRVLHVPGLGYDGIRGYNVIKVHRDSLGLSIAANEYGATFFGNSGRPSGALTHPGKPNKEERAEIREEWNQMHSGLTNAQRTAVLWGGMDWKAISIPPEEAQFLQTREMQIEEVSRILNINPILLQHFSKATTWGSGVAQFLVAYGKFTIAPWLDRDEDVFDWDLFPEPERGRFYTKYNLDALLRGDAETQAKVLEIKRRNGVINGDEWRELDDENPLPDGQGEHYFMPMNMMPITQLVQQPEPDPASPPPPSQTNARAREQRSIAVRKRLRNAHLPVIEDGVKRYLKRDTAGLRKAAKRAAEESDPVAYLNRWVEEFYPGQQQYIRQIMLPIVASMTAAIAAEAFDEVGVDAEDTTGLASSYTDVLAMREAGSSRGQVLALLKETQPAVLPGALSTRADEWEENRPSKVAQNEVVRISTGAARFAWAAAGMGAVWRAAADACPICREMDGKRVSGRAPFMSAGDVAKSPDPDTEDLTVEYDLAGPPLHKGCTCEIVPG